MGVVYRGRDPRIGGRAVAIKLLRVDDEKLRDRFLQEAAIAGNLRHDNIVTIYDFGEHEGQPYIVMEFVEGVTLAEQIRSNLQFSLPRKLELMHDLSLALDYAHKRGIVHRDIKPANVMIDRDDVLKVLDFGIARLSTSTMTLDGTMMGTPNYMSPEQVEGRTVDRRSDVFASGLVLYELLSYRQAFSGDTVPAVLNAIVHKAPPPLSEVFPGVDAALEAVVNRAIHKDPAERYQTMAAMASDIARIREQIQSRPADDEITVLALRPAPLGERGTPRPSTPHRQSFSRRRLEIIEGHLASARKAFEAGEYAAAAESCDQAALIDPDDERVIDLLERSRAALDRQRAAELTAQASAAADANELDRALDLVTQALEMDSQFAPALTLQSEVRERQQRARARQQAILSALARARENLANGKPESAIRAASDVLEQDPDNEEGHELTRQAFDIIEQRRQIEAHNRSARNAVDEQQRQFAEGRREEAIKALEAFAPPHELVTAALAALRAELDEIRRHEAEEEARRQREAKEAEERRQERLRWAAGQVVQARSVLDARQFGKAIEILRGVEGSMPDTPGLHDLLQRALDEQAAAEAEAARQRALKSRLEEAQEALRNGRLDQAAALADAAVAIAPDDANANALKGRVSEAIETKRQQEALQARAAAAVDDAKRQFADGHHEAALAVLDAFTPTYPLVKQTREELGRRLEQLRREEQERRRLEALGARLEAARAALTAGDFDATERALAEADQIDRTDSRIADLRERLRKAQEAERRYKEAERKAVDAAAAARARFQKGDMTGAIRALELFGPPHQVVDAALKDLRAQFAAHQAHQRQLEEQRREQQRLKEEEERRRKLDQQQQEAERQRRADEDREREEAKARALRIATAIQHARSAETPAEAVRLLQDALAIDRGNREIQDLLAARQAEMVAAVRRLIDESEFDDAAQALDEMHTLGISSTAITRMRDEVARAQQAQMKTMFAPIEGDVSREPPSPAIMPTPRPRELGPLPAPSPARLSNPLILAGVAVAVLAVGLGAWKLTHLLTGPAGGGGPTGTSTPTTVVPTTSVLPSTAPSTVPPTSTADDHVAVPEVLELVRSGNILGAARRVEDGLKESPKDRGLTDALAVVYAAAETRAETAKRTAESADARNQPDYAQAMNHVASAVRLRRSGRSNRTSAAVNEYLTATTLFESAAAKQAQVTTALTTTLTTVPPTVPHTVPPTVMTTAPTTSATTTTRSTTTAPAPIDQGTINDLLDRYGAVSRNLDVAEMTQFYPALDEDTKKQIAAFRKIYSSCDFKFTNVQIVSNSATTPIVQADRQAKCRVRFGTIPQPRPERFEFHFQKNPNGAWTIRQIILQ